MMHVKGLALCFGIGLLLLLPFGLVGCSSTRTGLMGAIGADAMLTVSGLESSMVEVRAARLEADHVLPWRNESPKWQTGYAVAIEPGLFLTQESLIRNHAAIQLRRAGSVQPVRGRVVLADSRVGLALVAADEAGWFTNAVPLDYLGEIPLEGDFTIAQWGENDHVQAGLGSLLSIGYASIGEGIPDQLTYELATSLQVKHSGAPVFYNGILAGIAVQSGRRGGALLVLAPEGIRRFLAAVQAGEYAGIAEPHFDVRPLADPVQRRYLGVPEEFADRGVYVRAVHGEMGDAAGITDLRSHDVLLAWDGEPLDARGNYQHPRYGSVPFRHLVASRAPGERVDAQIVRDRKILEIAVPVRPFDAGVWAIPENAVKEPADYVVAGGFVFRELTWEFLKSFGKSWQRRVDVALLWRALSPPQAEDGSIARTVILVGVLADPVNIGYRELQSRIVNEINGRPIQHLADLAGRIDTEGLQSITLDEMDAVPVVLDTDMLAEADLRIQQNFQIPALRRLSR